MGDRRSRGRGRGPARPSRHRVEGSRRRLPRTWLASTLAWLVSSPRPGRVGRARQRSVRVRPVRPGHPRVPARATVATAPAGGTRHRRRLRDRPASHPRGARGPVRRRSSRPAGSGDGVRPADGTAGRVRPMRSTTCAGTAAPTHAGPSTTGCARPAMRRRRSRRRGTLSRPRAVPAPARAPWPPSSRASGASLRSSSSAAPRRSGSSGRRFSSRPAGPECRLGVRGLRRRRDRGRHRHAVPHPPRSSCGPRRPGRLRRDRRRRLGLARDQRAVPRHLGRVHVVTTLPLRAWTPLRMVLTVCGRLLQRGPRPGDRLRDGRPPGQPRDDGQPRLPAADLPPGPRRGHQPVRGGRGALGRPPAVADPHPRDHPGSGRRTPARSRWATSTASATSRPSTAASS